MKRRTFLSLLLGAGGSLLASSATGALQPVQSTQQKLQTEQVGILHDCTRCIGCKACEQACTQVQINVHSIGDLVTEQTPEQQAVYQALWTKVTHYAGIKPQATPVGQLHGAGVQYRKNQCQHCTNPACVKVCPSKALYPLPNGIIALDRHACIGCGYCAIACPYDGITMHALPGQPLLPQKCTLCAPLLEQGVLPACARKCPTGALEFGLRKELLYKAHARISQFPQRYIPSVYGEYEGQGWLYLAQAPFSQLGFPAITGTHEREMFALNLVLGIGAIPFAIYAVNGVIKRRSFLEKERLRHIARMIAERREKEAEAHLEQVVHQERLQAQEEKSRAIVEALTQERQSISQKIAGLLGGSKKVTPEKILEPETPAPEILESDILKPKNLNPEIVKNEVVPTHQALNKLHSDITVSTTATAVSGKTEPPKKAGE